MRLRLLGSIAVALLPTISTTSSLNPFTWEEAERHESASSALLVADKARSTSRLTEVSHTSLPASRTSSNVCAISQQRSGDASPGPSLWILLPVIAAAAFFLLGWHCGARQAASAYALRTAEREDQFEQQAKADEAAEAEAAARLSTALVAVEAPINSEQRNGSIGDAVSLSSADSICEPAPAVDQDRAAESGNDVESSSNNAADPSQHHAQLESEHQHASTEPSISQASSQALHGSTHSSTHSNTSSSEPDPPQQQQQLQQQLQQSSRSLLQSLPQVQHANRGVAITNTAHCIVDQTLQQLGVNSQHLSMDQRLQLVSPVLQALNVVLHHHHKMEDQRLQGIANEQSAARNSIIEHGQTDERAWRQAKEQQRQLQDFKLQIADCMMCGLILMLIGMLYFGSVFGYYNGRLSQCTAAPYINLGSWWRPLKGLDILSCYVHATVDLVGSVVIMLFTVYCIKRFGLLTDSIARPMSGMILFLGVGCGWLGKFVIGRLGGSSMAWLIGYEMWVLLQVISVWCVHVLYRSLQAHNAGLVWQAFKLPCFMLLMGVVIPVAVSACPFSTNLASLF